MVAAMYTARSDPYWLVLDRKVRTCGAGSMPPAAPAEGNSPSLLSMGEVLKDPGNDLSM